MNPLLTFPPIIPSPFPPTQRGRTPDFPGLSTESPHPNVLDELKQLRQIFPDTQEQSSLVFSSTVFRVPVSLKKGGRKKSKQWKSLYYENG
jgi:hypothetical protein